MNKGRETARDCDKPGLFDVCRYVTELSPIAIVALEGITHNIGYANGAFCALVESDLNSLLGRRFEEAVPEGPENGCIALLGEAFESRRPARLADQVHRSSRFDPVFWSYDVWAATGPGGDAIGLIVQVTDTTDRALTRRHLVELNQQLLISSITQLDLAETSNLEVNQLRATVRETNHRVKNGLQMVSGLVDISDTSGSPSPELERVRAHIRALVTVHDLLTKHDPTDHTAAIRADLLLKNLLGALQQMVRPGQIHLNVDAVKLPGKQATSIALIVNECVMNASKHGSGDVHVSLRIVPEGAQLQIRDEGPGFPPDFHPVRSANTGVELISTTSTWDLQGSATFDNHPEGGARVTITFKNVPVASVSPVH
jgi:two-component sensor histidine kinase